MAKLYSSGPSMNPWLRVATTAGPVPIPIPIPAPAPAPAPAPPASAAPPPTTQAPTKVPKTRIQEPEQPPNSMGDEGCDCESYHAQGLACPCSVKFASKTGKRAVERILHKSVFFGNTHTDQVVKLQSEEEAVNDMTMASMNMNMHMNMDNVMSDSIRDGKARNRIVEVEPSHVQVLDELGKGGFCLVHNVELHLSGKGGSLVGMGTGTGPGSPISTSTSASTNTNTQTQQQDNKYCVKFLKPSILSDRRKFARGIADLAIEAHFLSTLNHPHILKIRGVAKGIKLFQPTLPKLTQTPGIEGGFFLILDKLHDTMDNKINNEWKADSEKYNSFIYKTTHDLRGAKRKAIKLIRVTIAIHLAEAMQYIHAQNICYRDLKPDNIGFDAEGNVKLFDFGLAKELKPYKRHADGTYQLTANTGSRRYMAPEVALRKRYNLAVDVFSFAILIWEMCALEKPFSGFTEMQHMNLVVQKGYRPKLDSIKTWPVGLKNVLTRCWDVDMKQRPDFREVVALLVKVEDELTDE
eukprot:CAMPEP_0194075976 /NCGR_PEP_ID=MMETSP0149-20130528/2855_1 /TAXON_ID=122233 /ORGANISM="Chaetoceros debilis, Strain MM31A-1" /LENGTH=522 /DNA_ID=CAMNT_0038756593 /DNA_START=833 /DNA_END=2401 /DNA_ORIENTATION=+